MSLISAYAGIFPFTLVGFVFLLLTIGLVNFLSIKRFDQYPAATLFPSVSILVPARNEAHNIEACLLSLLAQQYPDFEVLVLDDQSTDNTPEVLDQLADRDPRLHLLTGEPLPAGWLGKHWACHQLAQAAAGELILFTDADTRHSATMLRDSVSALLSEKADMVTAFPREKVETWGEKLIVPAISLFILCFLPLAFVHWMSMPSLAFAIGQFMLFRRSAYDAIGGYEQVRGDVVDDVALARCILRQGYRWRIMDGTRHVFCRMYRGFGDAADGFTKNLFAYFNHHVVLYMIAWLWIEVAFILPPVVLLAHGLGISVEYFPRTLALLATGASLLCWLIAYRRFRFPLVLILLYPLTLTLFVGIALRSMAYNLAGKATWKDRALIPPLWNW